jgi:FAD/FMN-containing dehydrogenase
MMLRTSNNFEDFPATFSGPVFRPNDVGFDQVRSIWNMRLDGRPSLIVRPRNVNDVVAAVRYASHNEIPLAIHSGGHGIDAMAMPDGALVIDNSLLKDISVDEATGRVTMQAGVRLGELDATCQKYGLVVPAGVVTDTGAAGLTLGGGIGHNIRRFGATVDNVLSIDIVTADGQIVTASAEENPELFWGLRGAGHNLGVATSFTYQGHKLGPQVMSGLLAFSVADAPRVFDGIDAVMAEAPRELAITFMVVPAMPEPGVPEAMVGQTIVTALVVYTGELDAYGDAIAGVLSLATPFMNAVRVTSWLEANSIVDVFTPPGRRYHMIGGYLPGLSAGIAHIAIDAVSSSPRQTPLRPACSLTFPILGGKLLDAAEDSTAFSREGAEWLFEVTAQWDNPDEDGKYMPWVVETMAALQPSVATNAYTNLSSDRGAEWLRGAYGSGEKWDRIVRLKEEWDPKNLFSFNKNVARAAKSSPVPLESR